MAKPDAVNQLKTQLGQALFEAPTAVSLHLSSGSVFLEDTVKWTGLCETRGQGA